MYGRPPSSLHQEEKSVIGLEREPNRNKRYNDNLSLFRCLALHRGCDLYRLEPAVKTLYEAYDRDDVPMEEFAGITLDDLYHVETTFQTNVCVYKLVKTSNRIWYDDRRTGPSIVMQLPRNNVSQPSQDTFFLHPRCTHVLSLVSMSEVR